MVLHYQMVLHSQIASVRTAVSAEHSPQEEAEEEEEAPVRHLGPLILRHDGSDVCEVFFLEGCILLKGNPGEAKAKRVLASPDTHGMLFLRHSPCHRWKLFSTSQY